MSTPKRVESEHCLLCEVTLTEETGQAKDILGIYYCYACYFDMPEEEAANFIKGVKQENSRARGRSTEGEADE